MKQESKENINQNGVVIRGRKRKITKRRHSNIS